MTTPFVYLFVAVRFYLSLKQRYTGPEGQSNPGNTLKKYGGVVGITNYKIIL